MKNILFEDKDIIVCRKPEGIPVQSQRIAQKDMESLLNNYLAEKRTKNGKGERIYVIHRLDQPVEGILVFAKNKKAAACLSGQISDGSMKKNYHAICLVTEKAEKILEDIQASECSVQGEAEQHSGEKRYRLTDYLIRNGKTNTSTVGKPGEKDAKESILDFCIRERKNDRIFVEIDLKTGRHHQIRVQMAHAGMPLIGDKKYNRYAEDGDPGIALCAVSLEFQHPSEGKRMKFDIIPEKEAFREWITVR